MLNLNGTFYGFDGTGKFRQNAVAHQLEDAPLMFNDLGSDQVFAIRLKRVKRACLVLADKATVTNHIGSQNGGESTLQTLSPSPYRLTSDDGIIHAFEHGPISGSG
jgi:hypothetical protein